VYKEIGAGNPNTNTIVRIQGDGNYAAKLCYDLVLGGYSDWYLPSMYELNKLYRSKTAIGGFSNSNYWSSSEYDSILSYHQDFSSGDISFSLGRKFSNFAVRAVRSF